MSEPGQGHIRKRPKRRVDLPVEYRCKRLNGTPKPSYRSQAKARKAIRLHDVDRKLYAYRCKWCGFWHLTHEPPRV
jgi:rubrerythrin